LAVPKGNPRKIKNLESLFAEDLRVVQANPEAAAVAKLTKTVLSKSNLWDRLDHATDAYRTTVIDVANDVKVGAADVGIVYDAVLHSFPDLEFVSIEELESAVSNVSIGILKSTKRPTAALHFARYVTARDRGLLNYQEHGFQTLGGDVWEDVPELTVYAGSMLRPAIEETIIAFESREGVSVSRSYNGCGILVGQMKAGQHPDAYFACDVEFMSQVKDIFPQSVDVSQNELVIIVPKGNPQKIRLLSDLTKPGLRVGIGHEKQCAMGWITQRTLKESGIQTEFMSNVTVQTPTGDAAGAADYLDAIQIVGLQCSIATQPWAVAKDSKHGRLADRLFQRICSAESQEVFQAEGFQWKLSKDSPLSSIEPNHSLSQ
jgi:ABC-type molybdate transport system substrate-binding protein